MKILTKYRFLVIILLLAAVLRFYQLTSNPPGLSWDQAVYGYDAYSILKTGKDHHGVSFPILFESFGDWKLPLFHYLLVPSIALFGLNEFGVRFPTAFLGTVTVLSVYLLTKKLLEDKNNKDAFKTTAPYLAAFLLSISPWHIQFSRSAFESTVGLFCVITGIWLLLKSFENKKVWLTTAALILFALSMYTYHAYRIFTPLLVLVTIFLFRDEAKKLFPKIIIPTLLILLMLIPLVKITFSQEGRSRSSSESIYSKEEFEAAARDFNQHSKKPFRFMSKYLYKPPVYYTYLAAKGYLDHFSPLFLFLRGDQIGRHSQVDMGQIYAFEIITLGAAVFTFKKINSRALKLMIAWLLLSPLSAAIVLPTPHAHRMFQMVMPLVFFSALGMYLIVFKNKLFILKTIFVVSALFFFLNFLHLLFVHYPRKFAADWQDGNRQMVTDVIKYGADANKIFITDINTNPYIFVLFYTKYPPQKYVEKKGSPRGFDKYTFISDNSYLNQPGKILYVAPSFKNVDGEKVSEINDTSGKPIYSVYRIDEQN